MAARSPSPEKFSSADRRALLQKHALFCELKPEAIDALAAHMVTKRVPRGTLIFSKNDPGTGLLGVINGTVKITAPSMEGREALLNIIYPGEIFGEIALLDGNTRSADATAMTDCELVLINRSDFVSLLSRQSEIAIKLIEILCAKLRNTSDQVHDVMFLNAPARIAKALLRIAVADEGTGKRKAKITQSEISQIAGLSREITNKQLRIWEEKRLVKIERGGVILLQTQALEEIAER